MSIRFFLTKKEYFFKALTLYGRLPDTYKQNIFRLYILSSLGLKTTTVHFQILKTGTESNVYMLLKSNIRP